MKNFCHLSLLSLCAIAFVISACTLDTEPEIPAGANNITNPVFLSAEVTPDTNNNFLATAWLSSRGNLNILRHGWVWSETPAPTLLNDHLDSGKLTNDTFSIEIAGLELGKIFYLRPFAATGCDTIYGPEFCSFLGVRFTINTDTEIFKGAVVQFDNNTVGNCSYLWDFGDGTASSTQASPEHTYNQKTGDVVVRLTANLNGCAVTRAMALKIVPDPFEDYWVAIPAGVFMMGCTAEQVYCETDSMISESEIPVHQVSPDSFFLGRTEITQEQWEAVLNANPSFFNQCKSCPVERVSWYDIKDNFLPALYRKTGRTHRLPSEAEWEYAARGGADASGMTIYAGSDSLDLVGWYGGNSDSTTHPVALKFPNGFGLYDMSGNVWEWVEDDYHISYYGAPANGTAWVENPDTGGRMYRGGSWQSDSPEGCRIPNRAGDPTETQINRIGFRLARSN